MSARSYKQTLAHTSACEKTNLYSAARKFFTRRENPCALAPYVLMTDPKRTPDVLAVARNLPSNAALVYRHFGAGDLKIAAELRQICFEGGAQFLIGKDWNLAVASGADGVHLPEIDIGKAARLRQVFPDWIVTAAVHSAEAINQANHQALNAVILSPIFNIAYIGGQNALGAEKFQNLATQSNHPIVALGGINNENVDTLKTLPLAGIAGVSKF